MTDRDGPRPVVDPQEVAAKVRELAALEASDRVSFAEALADNIMEPVAVETEAFRSEDLAFKSLAAARYLIANAEEVMRRRRRGSRQQRNTAGFIQKVGWERRILEQHVNFYRAQRGLLPNAPNPRQRAMRRLWNEDLKNPNSRARQLLEEERLKDVERKKQEKKNRQAARRAARNG